MRRFGIVLALAALAAGSAQAQREPPPPPLPAFTIEMLRADFLAASGSDTVYFANDGTALDAGTRATLTAQAQWLLRHSGVRVRVEGHTDQRETRARALAIAEKRADAVRDFLVLQGVPAPQITIISWGKERPKIDGLSPQAIAYNRRVVTVVMPL